MAEPMNTWADMIKVEKQLKTDAAKEKYSNIIIDTADLAYDMAETHVCNVHGVDTIGDIGYGKGYKEAGKNFEGMLNSIIKMGYGLILISHSEDKVFTDEQGREFNRIVSTLPKRPRIIVNRICDIIGYSRIVHVPEVGEKTYLYLRATVRYEAGSRFKYTPVYVEFSYQHLVDAIANAIDTQAAEEEGSVTDERDTSYDIQEIDFEQVLSEFKVLTTDMMSTEDAEDAKQAKIAITRIVEKNIGKGRRIAELGPESADIIQLVNSELKEIQEKQANDILEKAQE